MKIEIVYKVQLKDRESIGRVKKVDTVTEAGRFISKLMDNKVQKLTSLKVNYK